MLLVAVETLGATLAPVAHLVVLDGDAPIRRNALPDARRTIRADLQVLCAHLRESLDIRAQRLGHNVVQVAIDPALKRGDLALDHVHSQRLLLGVAPVDVQPRLDARREQERDAGLAADLLGVAVGQLRHELNDAAGGVAEKVDRVLNLSGSG